MEEGKDKIAISCGDILTLTQAMSSQEVKYARLEMKYERLEEDYINLKAQLAKSESERLDFAAENRTLKEKNQLQEEEINLLKARQNEQTVVSPMSEQEMIQKAITTLLEKYLLLSHELKARLLEVISNVVLLPGKPEQPKFGATINGGQTFFGNITNSEFLGKDKDCDE